mgnify:FL=1
MEKGTADRQDAQKADVKAAKKQAKRERIQAAIAPEGAQRLNMRAGLSAAIDARNHAKAFAAAVANGNEQAAKAAMHETLQKLAQAGRERGWDSDAS